MTLLLVYTAILASLLSVFSGIFAIGNGQHFKFKLSHLARGRRDAALYLWLTFSTIFGLLHCGALVDYGLKDSYIYTEYGSGLWMAIHTGVGLMNSTVHFFIKSELDRGDSHLFYFWSS